MPAAAWAINGSRRYTRRYLHQREEEEKEEKHLSSLSHTYRGKWNMNEERKKETPRGLTYSYLLFCRMQQVQHNTHTHTHMHKMGEGGMGRGGRGGRAAVRPW